MTDELRAQFLEIRGVGETTADEILAVLEDNPSDVGSDVADQLRTAHDYHENGDFEYAGKFLARAVEGLEE